LDTLQTSAHVPRPQDGSSDSTQLATFCRAVTGCPANQFIEFRALRDDRPARREFVHPEDARLRDIVQRSMDTAWNIFFGVAPRTEYGHGDRAHLASVNALWADMDYKLLPPDVVQTNIEAFALPPSVVVLSGAGIHLYYLFDKPHDFTEPSNFNTVKSLLRRLAIKLGADMAAAEPVRILRVPGSCNHKYNPPRRVQLSTFDSSTRYPISQLEDALRDVIDERARHTVEWKAPQPTTSADGARPGDDFNARGNWPSILEPHGWRVARQYGGVGYWCRPGKRDGISASTNYDNRDIMWVFTSNAPPLEPQRGYTKFGALAALEFHGDCNAAARQLARWGFGQ
jgi:hypothetical protein